jgi:tetratricopeptide (TPR) repeat protein
MEGDQYDEAMIQFNKALEMDDKSWKALQGLSKCLGEQEKYDEAASHLEHALQVVPDGLKPAASALRSDLTSVILSKRDFKTALRHAHDTYSSEPTDMGAIEGYVKALYAERDYDQIVDIFVNLRQLQAKSQLGPEWDFLSLRDVHHEIGSALRAKGRVDLVKPWIDGALATIDLRKFPWLAAWIAEFMYSFYDDTENSMAAFQSILNPRFKSNLAPELAWAYEYPSGSAEQILSETYFNNAVAAHKTGVDPEGWVRKLRTLASSNAASPGVQGSVYKVNDAALLFGMFLRRYGDTDESTWKPCFRDAILQSIDMLGDKDPMNDQSAYGSLATALFAAGDRSNAVAAAAVTLKPLEASSDPTSFKALQAINFTTYWLCDGPCKTQFNSYKEPLYNELYFCEDCLAACFCEECFPILKKGELPFRKCSPEHTFLQVYPVPKEAKDVAARFVDMKKVEVQKDWLDALRKAWV